MLTHAHGRARIPHCDMYVFNTRMSCCGMCGQDSLVSMTHLTIKYFVPSVPPGLPRQLRQCEDQPVHCAKEVDCKKSPRNIRLCRVIRWLVCAMLPRPFSRRPRTSLRSVCQGYVSRYLPARIFSKTLLEPCTVVPYRNTERPHIVRAICGISTS